jgi:hypothetical protein
MQEPKNTAIAKAEDYMATQGYKHGPCIGAECRSLQTQAIWNIEFAYEGLNSRSETTDPPSIVLVVNLDQNSVRSADWM